MRDAAVAFGVSRLQSGRLDHITHTSAATGFGRALSRLVATARVTGRARALPRALTLVAVTGRARTLPCAPTFIRVTVLVDVDVDVHVHVIVAVAVIVAVVVTVVAPVTPIAAPVPVTVTVTVPMTIPIPIPIPIPIRATVRFLVPVAITVWLALVFGTDAQVFGQYLGYRVFRQMFARGFPAVAVALVHRGLASQLTDGSMTFDHAGQCPAETLHVLVDVGEAPPHVMQMPARNEQGRVELRRLPGAVCGRLRERLDLGPQRVDPRRQRGLGRG